MLARLAYHNNQRSSYQHTKGGSGPQELYHQQPYQFQVQEHHARTYEAQTKSVRRWLQCDGILQEELHVESSLRFQEGE